MRGAPRIASRRGHRALHPAWRQPGPTISTALLESRGEEQVVDAQQLRTWDDYRTTLQARTENPSTGAAAGVLWSIFSEAVQPPARRTERVLTSSGMCSRGSLRLLADRPGPYDFVIDGRGAGHGGRHTGSSPRAGRGRPTPCSLPAISVNASSSSRSPGARSASISAKSSI